jgi:hypothetical protein
MVRERNVRREGGKGEGGGGMKMLEGREEK